jgi:hypothetical protein
MRAEKVVSPDSEKWFSILILKIYHKELKRVTFNHKITSQKNQEQNQKLKLCQTGP